MPRRGFIPKREVLPDPVYGTTVVTKLINQIMLDGKRGIAQNVCYTAFSTVAELFQVSDRVQKIHGVPRKPLDRLGEDDVDVSGFTLSQHAIELFTLFGAGAGDPVICKNASVFPFGVLLNQCAVIAHLCRKRVLHPL